MAEVKSGIESAVLQYRGRRRHKPHDHNANLAKGMSESSRRVLAQVIVENYEEDEQSRDQWRQREVRGMKALGFGTDTIGGADFEGASEVVHPLLAEACVQFQARAISEMFPAGGPVKSVVLGDTTEELEEQAERVKNYMNYQYLYVMPGAFTQTDKMLFRLPLSGSCFKKIFHNPMTGQEDSSFVSAENFVVPYQATDLDSAPRYTHVDRISHNNLLRLIKSGYYIDVDLRTPDERLTDQDVQDEIDAIDGLTDNNVDGDQRHTMLEQSIYINLDAPNDTSKVMDPYLVTVEKDSQEVVSIYRDWKRGDPEKTRRKMWTHYMFLPGLGFYGHGFVHAIGGLGEAATGALRQLLDAGSFANQQGGFRSRDLKVDDQDTPIAPGEYREVNATAEELKNGFVTLPYKDPSVVLFQLLQYLDEKGNRFASTTEAMTGEGTKNIPVGTIIARIEQGSKVFSAIHLRLHEAQSREFKILAELNGEMLPDEPYPYHIASKTQEIMRSDFDERVDVVPVSDPNSVSATQRIAQSQAVMELYEARPEYYDGKAVHRRMLSALRIQDIDEVMAEDEDVERMGPVEEDMAILMGKPIKAFPDQDHAAHMLVHDMWFGSIDPEMQELFQGQHISHKAEHMAWLHYAQVQEVVGGILPEPFNGEEPPEVENALAAMTAAAVQLLPQPVSEGDIEAERAAADIERKDQIAASDTERKDLAVVLDQQRKDVEVERDQERKDAVALGDAIRKNTEQEDELFRRNVEHVDRARQAVEGEEK